MKKHMLTVKKASECYNSASGNKVIHHNEESRHVSLRHIYAYLDKVKNSALKIIAYELQPEEADIGGIEILMLRKVKFCKSWIYKWFCENNFLINHA